MVGHCRCAPATLGTYPIVWIGEIHGHSLNQGYIRRKWQWRGKSGDRQGGPTRYHHNSVPYQKCVSPFRTGLPCYVKMLQLKRANTLSRSQRMAAIALTIIILLKYLAFYYAYGVFEGSVLTKKKRFFSRQKSRRCAPGGGGSSSARNSGNSKPSVRRRSWHAKSTSPQNSEPSVHRWSRC